MITGMVMPVLQFPSAFLMSFSSLMIPEMSEANAATHKNAIHYMTQRILRFALLFAVPTAVIFFFFADSLGKLLYGSAEVGVYLCVLAPIVPLNYLDSVVDGMLKGLNQQMQYLTYNIIDSALRVVLIFFLLPVMGIKGLVIVMFISAVLNTSLSLASSSRLRRSNFIRSNGFSSRFLQARCRVPCLVFGRLWHCADYRRVDGRIDCARRTRIHSIDDADGRCQEGGNPVAQRPAEKITFRF